MALPQLGAQPMAPQQSGFGSFLFGTPGQTQQFQRFNQPQQQLQNQSLNQALSLLQGMPGSQNVPQNSFAPIAQQARQQFNTQTIPGLAERFTAMGGGQRSSAFQGALGQAGSGLESSLAALGSEYGQRQQGLDQQLLGQLLNYGMMPSFENAYTPRQPGFLESTASGASQGIGALLPLLLSGGSSGILQLLSSLLGGK